MKRLINFFIFLFTFKNYSYAQDEPSPLAQASNTKLKRGENAEINKLYGKGTNFTPAIDKDGNPVKVENNGHDDNTPPAPPLEKTQAQKELEALKDKTLHPIFKTDKEPEPKVIEFEKGTLDKVKAGELLKDFADDDLIEVPDKPEPIKKSEYIASLPDKIEEPKDFKIGDKTFTKSEYESYAAKMIKDLAITEETWSKMSPEGKQAQLEAYLKFDKNFGEKNQEYAARRKELESRAGQVEGIFKTAVEVKAEITQQKADLEARIEKNKLDIKPDEELDKIDDYATQQRAINAKFYAQRENERLTTDLEVLTNRIAQQDKTLADIGTTARGNAINYTIAQIQEEIPELRLDLKEHPMTVIQKAEKGEELDDEKVAKANIIIDIATEYAEKRIKNKEFTVPILKYWNQNKYRFGVFTSAPQRDKEVKDTNLKPEHKIVTLKERQKNGFPALPGGSSAGVTGSPTDSDMGSFKLDRSEENRKKVLGKLWSGMVK